VSDIHKWLLGKDIGQLSTPFEADVQRTVHGRHAADRGWSSPAVGGAVGVELRPLGVDNGASQVLLLRCLPWGADMPAACRNERPSAGR
jgi:hypothetical protein